jgi:hypothetical protein
MGNFLDSMNFLNGSQRSILRQTGAATPVALEATLQAIPDVFERMLGQPLLRRLSAELDQLMTPEERRKLKDAEAVDYPLGVAVDEEFGEIRTTPLHRERDRLFEKLRELKAASDQSAATIELIESVQEQLRNVLKSLNETKAA